MRLARAFGAFWYDFLVGDRPELFVGPLAVLAVVWLLHAAGVADVVAGFGLFAGACAVLALSLALVLRGPRA